MENTEYELVKGVYLSGSKTDKPNCDGFYVNTVDSGDVYIYMSYTDEIKQYSTVKEDDLRKAIKKLFPNKEIDPEELLDRTFYILGNKNNELAGVKYEKKDGTFAYKLRNKYYSVCTIPFLHKQNLSFDNPKDIEIMKSYQDLEWPNFSADQTELATLMEAKGYPVKHYGRSGFESRNHYYIELPDTPEENIIEVIAKINADIEASNREIEQKDLKRADKEFAENALDKDAVFSYLDLGGGPSDLQIYDTSKYEKVGSYRLSACQDSRRHISHIYRTLLCDIEKLKQTDKKVIELSGALGLEDDLCLFSRKYNISFKAGKNTYILDGRVLSNVSHFDLDLSKSEDVEKALAQDKLDWPVINATSKQLAAKMEALGYVLEYSGRSGFESRNSIIIKTKDGILTPEIAQKMEEDLKTCKIERKQEKLAAFDTYFDAQSTDKSKVYAVVETGYNYGLTRVIDEEKYERIAKVCIAYTSDYRRGYDHTYAELIIHKERIKKDERKYITFEVPKEMIGLIIGKKGANIQTLQQKFSKCFNVVQDPKEIEAEKKQAEKEQKRKHQNALNSLQNNIREFMGKNFLIADDESIAISMVEYININQAKLPLSPNADELQQMKDNLIKERDEEIKRENERKAAEIAYQKRLEEERLAEQKRLEQEKITEITQTAKTHIQTYADEHSGAVISNEDFIKFLRDTYQEDELAQKVLAPVQKDFLLKMEEERAMQQRFAEAEKNFDKVAAEEFKKFFESDFETDGHGYDYFNIVGKARRKSAYSMIAQKVSRRLGIEADLHKTLEERLLDPRLPDNRIGSWLYEEDKFCDRIVEFNESEPTEPAPKPIVAKEPEPAPEPTIENLAALWGAKKGKLK